MNERVVSFESARSDRVLLRKAVPDDLDAYVAMYSDPEVRRHLGGPVPADRIRRRVEIRGTDAITAESGSFIVADPSTDALLGTVMLERRPAHRPGHVDDAADELELSYMLRQRWWGRGLASEAVDLLLRTAAQELPDQIVLVVTQESHAASLALAQRMGFEYVSTIIEFNERQWLGARRLHAPGGVAGGVTPQQGQGG